MKARVAKKINKNLSGYKFSTIDNALRKYNKLIRRGDKWKISLNGFPIWAQTKDWVMHIRS